MISNLESWIQDGSKDKLRKHDNKNMLKNIYICVFKNCKLDRLSPCFFLEMPFSIKTYNKLEVVT